MKLKAYLANGKSTPPRAPDCKETDWMLVDRFVVSCGTIWIGDPVFSWAECRDSSGCTLNVPSGVYVVEAKARDFGGTRLVTRMRVYLDASGELTLGTAIGDAGTDSGQLGVCDPELIIQAFAAAFANDEDQILDSLKSAFDDSCGVYRPNAKAEGCVVYVPSGYGDGGGPVLELRAGRRAVGLETEFIANEGE